MSLASDEKILAKALSGMVDMHTHSGPSPMPRRFDHAEAARDAQRLNMRAIVVKSHHHNTQMDVLAMAGRIAKTSVKVFGGIALNSTVGGLNPHAVRMSLRMGGKVVWFPTISSGRHIECHPEGGHFPTTAMPLTLERIDIVDESGELKPVVFEILDEIREQGAILSGGHMYPEYIRQLFEAAKDRGITRMMVNHPDFVIGAEPELCLEYVRLGGYIEHEIGMYDPEGGFWPVEQLMNWIGKVGPEHTVLASDLGQYNTPKPVDAFVRVCTALLDAGLSVKDLRQMVCENPAFLLDLN